jgi:ABC-type uncharacterized transport system auxiliary subunit
MRPRSIRAALAAALAAALMACSLSAPPIRYFEVRPTRGEAATAAPTLPSVIVPNFSCLSAYDHLRVVVRRSDVEVVTSRSLQWTTVPGRMLSQGVRYYLEGTGRFETVRRDAKPRPPYTVEGQVQVIELIEKPAPAARLALHVNVRRSADGVVIAEEFIDESRKADGADPGDGILAMRALYTEILARLSARVIAAIEKDVGAGGS